MPGATNNTNFLAATNETIRVLNELTAALNCACMAMNRAATAAEVTPMLPQPNANPNPTAPTDPAPPTDTGHTTWDSYLCGCGAVFCDNVAQICDDIATLDGTLMWSVLGFVGVVMGVLAAATGGAVIPLYLAAAAETFGIIGQITEWTLAGAMQIIANQMRNNSAMRGCVAVAFRDGDGVDAKLTAVRAAVDEGMNAMGFGALSGVAQLLCFREHVQALAYGVEDEDGTIVWIPTPVGVFCGCNEPQWQTLVSMEYWNGGSWGYTHVPANPGYTGSGWIGDASSLRQVGDGAYRVFTWEGMGMESMKISLSGTLAPTHNPAAPIAVAVWSETPDGNPTMHVLGYGQPGENFAHEYTSPITTLSKAFGIGGYGLVLGTAYASLSVVIEAEVPLG